MHILTATGGLVPPERSLETRKRTQAHSPATARLVRVERCFRGDALDRAKYCSGGASPSVAAIVFAILLVRKPALRRGKLGGGECGTAGRQDSNRRGHRKKLKNLCEYLLTVPRVVCTLKYSMRRSCAWRLGRVRSLTSWLWRIVAAWCWEDRGCARGRGI